MEDYTSSGSQKLSATELKDSKPHDLELQLAKSKEEKAQVSYQLQTKEQEIQDMQKLLTSNQKTLHEQERRIKELEFQLEQKNGYVPPASNQILSFQQELKRRDEEIKQLRELIKNKDTSIQANSSTMHLDFTKIQNLEQKLAEKDQVISNLNQKLSQGQQNLDSLYLSKRSEGTLLLELEHYKSENARLVKLLKSTQEYQHFAEFAEASAGIRYIPKSDNCKGRQEKCPSKTSETEDWVPSEAWRLAHDFLAKHGSSGFKAVHINRLLEDINKIWRLREKSLVNQVKSKCNRELETLRRKLSMRPDYNQVQSQREISRLKGDLKKAQSDLKTFSSATARNKSRPSELTTLDNVFKIVADFQHDNKALALENAKLRAQLP